MTKQEEIEHDDESQLWFDKEGYCVERPKKPVQTSEEIRAASLKRESLGL